MSYIKEEVQNSLKDRWLSISEALAPSLKSATNNLNNPINYSQCKEEVLDAAKGHWLSILKALAPSLEPAIDNLGCWVNCLKPKCSGNFRINKKDADDKPSGFCNSCGFYRGGLSILSWITEQADEVCLAAVADYLKKVSENHLQAASLDISCDTSSEDENRQRIERAWSESVTYSQHDAPTMSRYFKRCHLNFDEEVVAETDSLRFHPNLDYFEEDKKLGKFPAIVCAVRNATGKLITLHRTYLTRDGNLAHVKNPHKFMPLPEGLHLAGGAIQLGKPLQLKHSGKDGKEDIQANVIGIAESLETALSVFTATLIPTWATITGDQMKKFDAPKDIDTVIIWADRYLWDEGQVFTNVLSNKLQKQGIQVHVCSPDEAAIPSPRNRMNWNDVLKNHGRFVFPQFDYLRNFILRNKK